MTNFVILPYLGFNLMTIDFTEFLLYNYEALFYT